MYPVTQYSGGLGAAGSMPMYADPQYGGMPAFTSIPPQQMVHAIPMGAIGFSGAPSQAFPSQGGLMAMAPAPPSSFSPSDPTVLHDRFLDPMGQYPGADIDVRSAGGRALFMQQGPQQRVTPQHLMPAPPPQAPPLYGAAPGGPMYLATHHGDAGYPPPPPPPPHSGGPRGKVMHHHYRGMPPAQPHLMHPPPPMHHQHSQHLAMQHHHQQQQQQPPKRRTQRGMEENIRRTVYVSYIDLQVTEEMLANSFSECGTVVDCRICGDPNSAMRFAFIEFSTIAEAQRAQVKSGMVLGSSPLRVLPSKTAIVPVSRELMPRSNDEVERCSRTVYVANIDKKVDRSDVRSFFEGLCGPVSKLRLLGDYAHSTRISFIEFVYADSAMQALNCSGALLGTLPIRVSPSKTPVRSEASHKDRRGGQQQQQQQRLLMPGGQGSSGGGSLHDDDGMYNAEQEQLMAMHLAQTAGTPAEGMQLLEAATLVQQQQLQQQEAPQLTSTLSTPAAQPMIVQAPPSPPLVNTTDPSAATATAADTPSSLVAATQPPPPPSAFSPPPLPLPQPEEVAPSAASFASKYPVIRGRSHHSAPGVTPAAPDAPAAAAVLPAAMVPSGPPAPTAAAAGVPGGVGEPGRASAPGVVLQAAVPQPQLQAPAVVPAASQPPPAAAVVVLPTAESPADALASQLGQLQVQQQPAGALTGTAPTAPTAAAPAAAPAAQPAPAPPAPAAAAAPIAAPAAGAPTVGPGVQAAVAPVGAFPAPVATPTAVHMSMRDDITAGLPVPLPLAASGNLEVPAAVPAPAPPVSAPAPTPIMAAAPVAEKGSGDLVPPPAAAATTGGMGGEEGLAPSQPSQIAVTARAGGCEEQQAAAVPPQHQAAAAAAALQGVGGDQEQIALVMKAGGWRTTECLLVVQLMAWVHPAANHKAAAAQALPTPPLPPSTAMAMANMRQVARALLPCL
mmetsp:Transcript_11786/g.30890  ORF Transcript_11786/g.30890 Transcript_11786/m.30890 type:complete len:953 (-) Transcript_11786:1024-3882(-)